MSYEDDEIYFSKIVYNKAKCKACGDIIESKRLCKL